MLALALVREIDPMKTQVLNKDYFAEHIEAHLDHLYGSALRLTKVPSDAEDLVADTVTKAWTCIDSLQDTNRFVPWMLRIMTNLFISQKRKLEQRTPHESYLDDADGEEKPFSLFDRLHQPFLLWWGNPEQEFLNKLLQEDLESAIDELPEVFRVAVVLSDVEGLTYQEIAVALDVPTGTVRSRLARGRSLLQKALWKHAQDRGLGANKKQDTGND